MATMYTHSELPAWHVEPKIHDIPAELRPVGLRVRRHSQGHDSDIDIAYDVVEDIHTILTDPLIENYETLDQAIAALERAYPTNVPHASRVVRRAHYHYDHTGRKWSPALEVHTKPIVNTTDPLVAAAIVKEHGTQRFARKLNVEDSADLYLLVSKDHGYYQYGTSPSWNSRRHKAAKAQAARLLSNNIFDPAPLNALRTALTIEKLTDPYNPSRSPLGRVVSLYPKVYYHDPFRSPFLSATYAARRKVCADNVTSLIQGTLDYFQGHENLYCRYLPEKVVAFLQLLPAVAPHLWALSDRRQMTKFVVLISRLRRRVGYHPNPLPKEFPSE